MTIEEAIEKLTDEKDTIIKARAVFGVPDYGLPDEQYDIAIAALEKQIPKKPLEGAVFKHIGKCPDCGQAISTRSASSNCQYCGQKIDWRYFD